MADSVIWIWFSIKFCFCFCVSSPSFTYKLLMPSSPRNFTVTETLKGFMSENCWITFETTIFFFSRMSLIIFWLNLHMLWGLYSIKCYLMFSMYCFSRANWFKPCSLSMYSKNYSSVMSVKSLMNLFRFGWNSFVTFSLWKLGVLEVLVSGLREFDFCEKCEDGDF